MTGYDIFNNAAILMGAKGGAGDYKELLPEVALCAVNRIGGDLFGDFSLGGIFDEVSIPAEAQSAFIYGVAMVICAALEKYEAGEYFTNVYNAKRAAVKSGTGTVKNVIPFV